jgi:PiT family inorganic phosphate transporter
LGTAFVLPLLLSPILAIALGGVIYLIFRFARLRFGVSKEMCVCVGNTENVFAMPQPAGVFAAQSQPILTVAVDKPENCQQRYAGDFLGVKAAHLVDSLHFISAGAVSFARGLNDTPKIAALLLVATVLDIRLSMVGVAVAMGVGGWLNARKVADTMANKITKLNSGQGCSANLATAILVTTASYHGLPVSTTHVSVGSLLGIGITTGSAQWKSIAGILLSWVITLPCAALIAGIAYMLVRGS